MATTLYTPGLDLGILAGVTRATLLELAPACGFRVEEGAYPLEQLLEAEEAFTSSSVREVMPLVEIDGRSLGRGPAADELQAALARSQLRSERWTKCLSGWGGWHSRTACSCTGRRPGAAPFAMPEVSFASASGRKPHFAPAARSRVPILRGPIALGRGVRPPADGATRRFPPARFPFERPCRARLDRGNDRCCALPPALATLARNARARRRRDRVRSGATRTSWPRPRCVSRRRARLDRHLRERRDAGVRRSILGVARSSIAPLIVDSRRSERRRRRRRPAGRPPRASRAPRCGRGFRRALRAGWLETLDRVARACSRAAGHRAPAAPLDRGAAQSAARGRERAPRACLALERRRTSRQR